MSVDEPMSESEGSSSESSESSSESSEEGLTAVSQATFKQILEAWLAANHDRVDEAYESGSGWEGWLHVELYLAIKSRYPNADIRREPHGYGSRSLRADLVLNANVEDARTCVIEIKTELKSEDGLAFWRRVGSDVVKGATLSKELIRQGATALAVAIFLSKEAWAASKGEIGEKKPIGKYIGCYYGTG